MLHGFGHGSHQASLEVLAQLRRRVVHLPPVLLRPNDAPAAVAQYRVKFGDESAHGLDLPLERYLAGHGEGGTHGAARQRRQHGQQKGQAGRRSLAALLDLH